MPNICNCNNLNINLIWPVGSYYWSSVNINPSNYFGGVWEQVKDRFVLAAGDKYGVGEIGGEANHKLTVDEIPSHTHELSIGNGALGVQFGGDAKSADTLIFTHLYDNLSVSFAGGNKQHNNMPPYIVAYCWHRIS